MPHLSDLLSDEEQPSCLSPVRGEGKRNARGGSFVVSDPPRLPPRSPGQLALRDWRDLLGNICPLDVAIVTPMLYLYLCAAGAAATRR